MLEPIILFFSFFLIVNFGVFLASAFKKKKFGDNYGLVMGEGADAGGLSMNDGEGRERVFREFYNKLFV